ncbi:DUF2062 domain-containing protein [Frigidibacter sp. ROC022]|uniref:DUF2062 domain-containing protein n=1 Tax=Frigidibacter sp. ROC022 TaxID=2971796 RepID=UPI00215B0A97|nr:DUF2062 domain-containing protein [Frigidibacter sp. ROC022]
MVFKRRTPRGFWQRVRDFIYPRGGWGRAISYVIHRLRRLPDPPYRVARGVAAGIFVCFTPFYGFHFLLAGLLAYLMRGNILAALMATFFGNPLTFPIIATISVELGAKMLGLPGGMPLHRIVGAFSSASLQLWANLAAIFTAAPTHWDRLGDLFGRVFLPYLVGGLLPGIISAVIGYMATHRIVVAYQKRRKKKLKSRVEKRRAAAAAESRKTDAADSAVTGEHG